MVGVGSWLFSLTDEGIEDVAALVDAQLPLHDCFNSVLAKVVHGMVPEVVS